MGKQQESGIFKTDEEYWGYRFSILIDGKRVTRRRFTDDDGNKFSSKRAATKARETAIANARLDMKRKTEVTRKTVQDVYEEYCAKGRSDRAYGTIRKQDSLWENHISSRFGKRMVDDISVAEVTDYLAELYYHEGLSFMYVESFLKMFYLIFGQAYSRNYLSVDTYNKLCVNKDTKIRMPKIKTEDDTDIVAYTQEELQKMDQYFSGSAGETAYLLGRYCGLRINECYGLKWDHVDLKAGTILIDRQMQYQDGLIKLVPPKTRNAKRTIYMSGVLKNYLQKLNQQWKEDEVQFAALWEQNRRQIEDMDGKKILSTELVNCLPNGKIQTVNSMKYHAKEIKTKLNIQFKYHNLRHTYGTMMAEMNTPAHLLCDQMGHGNIHVTQKYYIAISKSGIETLRKNLNQL